MVDCCRGLGNSMFYSTYGKRWFDLILTVPGFVAISPLLGVIALLVRFKLGSPVLFRQVRPGLYGKPFTIYKFRTMTDVRDREGISAAKEATMPEFFGSRKDAKAQRLKLGGFAALAKRA